MNLFNSGQALAPSTKPQTLSLAANLILSRNSGFISMVYYINGLQYDI